MYKNIKSPFLLLALMPFVFFWKVIFADRFAYATSELLTTYLPNFVFMSGSWRNGNIPLWHPFHHLAFAGVATQGVFYPFNILLSLILNPKLSLNTFFISIQFLEIFHVFLASISMYLLMRRLKTGKAGSFFSAIAFAYSPIFLGVFDNPCFIYSLSYFPLAFLLFSAAFHNNLIYGLFSGLVLGLMFLAGYIPVPTYTFFALIFYALFQIYACAPQKRKWYFKRAFLSCFITFPSAFLVAAAQIIPTYEYSKLTIRMSQNYDSITAWGSIPGFHLITFLMPFFFGGGTTHRELWLARSLELSYTAVIYYVGILTLLLVLCAVIIYKDKRTRFFAVFFTFSLFAMLGYNSAFFGWLYSVLHLPLVRIPSRFALFTTFSLSVMSGFGLDNLINSTTEALEKTRKFIKNIFRPVLIFSLILLILLWLLKIFKGEVSSNAIISFRDTPVSYAASTAIESILKFTFFFIALLIPLHFYTKKKKIYLIAIVVLIGVVDIFHFSGLLNPTDASTFIPESTFKDNRIVKYIQQDKEVFRVSGLEFPIYLIGYVAKIQHLGYTGGFSIARFAKFRGLNRTNDALGMGRGGQSWFELRNYPTAPSSQLIDFYNIKYFIFSQEDKDEYFKSSKDLSEYDPKYKKVAGFDNLYINTKVFPRAFTVHTFWPYKGNNPDEILEAMQKIDLSKEAIVEAGIEGRKADNLGDEIHIEKYSPSFIHIKADMKSEGLLILTDVWYPGWKVYVDGKERGILRADYVFRGVLCEAGNHNVVFKYEPFSVKAGIVVSIISLVLVLITLCFMIIKRAC